MYLICIRYISRVNKNSDRMRSIIDTPDIIRLNSYTARLAFFNLFLFTYNTPRPLTTVLRPLIFPFVLAIIIIVHHIITVILSFACIIFLRKPDFYLCDKYY